MALVVVTSSPQVEVRSVFVMLMVTKGVASRDALDKEVLPRLVLVRLVPSKGALLKSVLSMSIANVVGTVSGSVGSDSLITKGSGAVSGCSDVCVGAGFCSDCCCCPVCSPSLCSRFAENKKVRVWSPQYWRAYDQEEEEKGPKKKMPTYRQDSSTPSSALSWALAEVSCRHTGIWHRSLRKNHTKDGRGRTLLCVADILRRRGLEADAGLGS